MSESTSPMPRRADTAADADPYYIRTEAAVAPELDLVLKQDDTFLVLDRSGDVAPIGLAEGGLYHDGMRHLSRFMLRIGGRMPQLLSAAVSADNSRIRVHLSNVDITHEAEPPIARGALHVARDMVLWQGTLHERLRLRNYGRGPARTRLTFEFDADFADIFEVRGIHRPRRGRRLPDSFEAGSVVLAYKGLDDVVRSTRITITPAPAFLGTSGARLDVALDPGGETVYDIAIACEIPSARPSRVGFSDAAASAVARLGQRRAESCGIATTNRQFNAWVDRSIADLSMMMTDTPYGPFPYAGVPWFSTPFGRDSLVTALECLWCTPAMARAVLGYLAATQATTEDPLHDAQPGKILHEARAGEMAAVGEVPFGRYYGSHDATPLFVILAAAYYRRTGDRELVDRIWPNIEAALAWITRYGDLDGDGFIEYQQQSPNGLVHQGWKDSHDAVSHSGGGAAPGPIALCELQGYVYAAWQGGAELATVLGHDALAADLHSRAGRLRERFEEAFWCPEIGTYALALDGDKRPCAVVTSNAGYALLTGIGSTERAQQVAEALLAPESFSGWGVRTLATNEACYNPMSYHNGSIWPHDNALVARGLARYGFRDGVLAIFDGLFAASISMDFHRLPELFCGFPRREGEDPVPYPVACNPQAWASASVFMLLGASLGLDISAPSRLVRFTRAKLPTFLDEVWITNLRVGATSVDLHLKRHRDDVGINVTRREGDVEVVAIK